MQIEDEVTNDYEGFWGLILEPNRSIQQVVEAAFCITGASFGPNVKGEGRSSVQVLIEKNNFVLANLLPGKIENATLNARFTEGTKMTLSVTGNNAVHLTGFHLPPPESFDYEDEDEYDDEDDDDAMYYGQEDDGEDDDEDDEDDDEDLHHGHAHALNQAKQARLHRLAQLEAEDDDDEDDDVEGEDDDEEDEDEEENGILHHHDGEEDDEDDDEVDPEEDALLAQAWYRKAYGDKNGDVDEEDEDEDDDDDLHEDDEEALAVRQAVQDLKRGRDAKDSKQQQHQQQQPAKKHAGEDKSGKPAASKTPEPKQPAKQQQQQQQQQQPKKGDSKPNTPAKAQQQQQQQTPKSENKAGKADSKPATPQQQQQQQQQKQNASGNKADAKSPAKQTLAGGLQVQDKKTGSGKKATKGKKVSVRYIGRLDNGKVFDSNTSGKPFSFKLGAGEVIKGWDVGIEGMSVGSERILTIPPPLAYGAKGSLPDIPKNATLTFEVKLLSVD